MVNKLQVMDLAALLALGLLGALGAAAAGLPMPWMLGSLTLSAAYTIAWNRRGRAVQYPRRIRHFFIATIGTMIGSRFTPELPALILASWPSFLAVPPFVLLAYGYGYAVLRGLGGYDRPTATYGALPGGLMEAMAMGERAGADMRLLTVQHFLRIIVVVVTVPLLFRVLGGESVGSSAGVTMENGPSAWSDLALIAALSLAGAVLGEMLRLPAGMLMGPLVLCALAQVTGLVDLHSPGWLLNVAQLAIGTGLGAQFAGIGGRTLLRGLGLGTICVAGMLAMAGLWALALDGLVRAGFDTVFVSFAPGGMTEMALIALSLEASPVMVTAHHLLRIVVAVLAVSVLDRWRAG
jgi:hypothetical protein